MGPFHHVTLSAAPEPERPDRTGRATSRKGCRPAYVRFEDALRGDEEMAVAGKPVSPGLHITLHQIVASQLLAGNPPEIWQTVHRLAALGCDWHNIMHMIARLVSDGIYHATPRQQQSGPGDYARQLAVRPEAEVQPDNAEGTHEHRRQLSLT